jgi:hypothetical protein
MIRTIVIAAAMLVALPGDEALAKPRPHESQKKVLDNGLTRLRSRSPSTVIVSGRAGVELRHINVEVVNIGNFQARGVRVFAECGRGVLVPLNGPAKLSSGQRAVYISRGRTPLIARQNVQLVTECENCRK